MFSYKPVVTATAGPYFGAALVGTYSTVIGWNMTDKNLRIGLHGFAIKRTEWVSETGDILGVTWLGGYKRFLENDTAQLGDVGSLTAPFQRFRWNDYTLKEHCSYRYEVFPMRGAPGVLTREEPPLVFEFTPSPEDDGALGVFVNRGVSAAKAYFRRFGDVSPSEVVPKGAAYAWLSRGLRESLIDFIQSAESGDALHLAVYEFFDLEIAELLFQRIQDGVSVIIVHDAKKGKRSTKESRHIAFLSKLDTLAGVIQERTTVNISHNKLAIHLKNGQPVKMWAGTVNLSENGFNYQTNSALVIRDENTLNNYEAYFQNLLNNPSKADSKDFNIDLMTQANAQDSGFVNKQFFSPIRKQDIIATAVELINRAESMILISAPFGLHKDMKAAIQAADPQIVKYGLVNATAQAKVSDLRRFGTRFFPPKKLKTFRNERWDAKAFGAHKIHTKTIVIDPFGNNPAVFTGSANFSKASCVDNDENAVLIEGNPRLAAIYATEFMRMYDHYKSRFYISRTEDGNKKTRKKNRALKKEGKPLLVLKTIPYHLETTEKWSNTAFSDSANSHKNADRKAFSGL